jgi:CheY-like chemotaxis protein
MSATILVLEDDTVLQALLCEVLEDEGFHVVAADTLPALVAAAPAHADLLISDLLVNFEPVGLDAIRRARQLISPALPCVICTAAQKQIEAFQPEIERLGAHVLPKPFTIDELIATVMRVLKPAPKETIRAIPPLLPALA